MHHDDIVAEAERLRARHRELDRKRRQEMSRQQRDAYLAQRRRNYRRRNSSINDQHLPAGKLSVLQPLHSIHIACNI